MSTPSTGRPVSEAADLREQARLDAVRTLGLLDEPVGTGITEIVRLAAEVCGVPTAVINIFDQIWVHPLGSFGADLSPSRRDEAPCDQVLQGGEAIITADARLEPRFAGNRYVDGPDGQLRFYAGVPLTTGAGHIVGTLCTYDLAVHEITAGQVSLLRALASQIMGIFELRQSVARSTLAAVQLAALADQADEVMQTSVDAYYAVGPDSVVRVWNRAAEELFGYLASEAVGRELVDLIVPERFQELALSRRPTALTQPRAKQRVTVRRKDGSELTVDVTSWPSRSMPGWHTFARDVSELVCAEQERAAIEERWRVAFEHAPVGMAVNDVSTPGQAVLVSANRKYCEIMGRSFDELQSLGVLGLTHPDDLPQDVIALAFLLDGSLEIYRTDKRYLNARGQVVWGRLTASLARTSSLIYMISQVEDITEARAAERARRQAESLLAIAFKPAPHGTAVIGVRGEERGRLLRVNPALITMTRRVNLVGAHLASLLDDDTSTTDSTSPADSLAATDSAAADVLADFEQLADGELDLVERVCRLRAGHGHIFAEASITLSRDGEGNPEHALAQLRDITQQHAHEEWLTRHAKTDTLTGLANRLAMRERLVHEIDALRAGDGALAVLMIDLDNFKKVNDTLGHAAGDELLRQVAEALVSALPPEAMAARLGGDEFIVIAPRQDPIGLSRLADRVAAEVDRVGAAMGERIGCRVTGSIGHTMTENPSTAPEDLIREADHAMYQTKRGRLGPSSADFGQHRSAG